MPEPVDLQSFAETAQIFWDQQAPSSGERIILVEAMAQDLRVTLRNLTVANALRRFEPARLVLFAGADDEWNRVVWTYYDLEVVRELAESYGAEEFFDLHQLVDDRLAGRPSDVVVAGVDLSGPLDDSDIPPETLAGIVEATTCRMELIARLNDSEDHVAKRRATDARSRELARVFDALIGGNDVVALVNSHVDYANFGLAVEAALRHEVPVLFPQSTGGLKAYALFPEHHAPGEPVRAGLTRRIGTWFESHVWPHRELLRTSREMAVAHSKATRGRPSWWRGGSNYSSVTMRNADDRSVIRKVAARGCGLDPDKPVIGVFNHAVSDALGTNVEAFADLGAWFEATAEYAAEHPEVEWLFVDHPSQVLYDAHGFFDRVAARFADQRHMTFRLSMSLSKNSLVSLTDLVLTVRGSVSNEYPALGIPALQAGWSEWSHCGFTTVASSPDEYFAALDDHLDGLLEGRVMISPEQIERARLWVWFYRSGTDLSTELVPPWRAGEEQPLFDRLRLTFEETAMEGDPAFVAMRRLWDRREPFLTRVDMDGSDPELVSAIAPPRSRAGVAT